MKVISKPLASWRGVGLSALAAAVLLAACGETAPPPPPPPPEVTVAQPIRRPVTSYLERTGTTRAVRSVEINARVPGVLESMHFEPSTRVSEGQRLFVIEPYTYKATRDAAEAALRSAEADLARAESDLKRIEQAIQTDAVSQSDLDLARAGRDMARAQVLSAEATLAQAELQFSYTDVRAPLTGQIGRNLVDVGNVVGGGGPSTLAVINQMQPIHVYFNVPEEEVVRVLRDLGADASHVSKSNGYEVFVATLADEGFVHEGVIDFIANEVDASTGTIELRAELANQNLELFPGLFVRVRVPTGTVDDAVLVQETAIATDLGGRYVYVVGPDNVVEQRYVSNGPVEGDGMIPVLDGLDGSETYIVEGLLRARPGLPVTPTPAGSGG